MNRFQLFMGYAGLVAGSLSVILGAVSIFCKYPEIGFLAMGLFLMKEGREDVIKFGKQRNEHH